PLKERLPADATYVPPVASLCSAKSHGPTSGSSTAPATPGPVHRPSASAKPISVTPRSRIDIYQVRMPPIALRPPDLQPGGPGGRPATRGSFVVVGTGGLFVYPASLRCCAVLEPRRSSCPRATTARRS